MDAGLSHFELIEQSIRRVHDRCRECNSQHATMFRLQVLLVKLLNELTNEILKPFGMNNVSFSVLMMMYGSEDGGLSPSAVSDYTGESRANITRVTDELVQRALIDRAPSKEDRRKFVLSLTDAGEQLVTQVLPLIRDRLAVVFSELDDAQARQLIGMQKTLLSALEAIRPAGKHS